MSPCRRERDEAAAPPGPAPRSEGPAPHPQPPAPSPRRGGAGGPPIPYGHPRDTQPRCTPGLTGFQQGAQGERQQHGGVAAHDRGSALPDLGLLLSFSSFSLPSRLFQRSRLAASGAAGSPAGAL